jgi:hypothetical protein
VGFGASIDCHYCDGKLADLKICGIAVKTNCPMKSMHANCCENKVHFCKTDHHQTPTVATVATFETSLKVPVILVDLYNFSLSTIDRHSINHFRPGNTHWQQDCPLFISKRVFRI